MKKGGAGLVRPDSIYRSVLIMGNWDVGSTLMQVAQRLKQRHNSRITLIANTIDDKADRLRRYPGLFDVVEESQFRYRSVFEPLEASQVPEWLSAARGLEERLDFRFAHLLMDDRHFGIGFSAAGTGYPETPWSMAADYPKALRSYVLFLRFLDELISREGITLVINPHKACAIVARARGIPIRNFTAACFKNYWTWYANEFMESNLLPEAYGKASEQAGEQLTGHYDIYLRVREEMFRRFSTSSMLYHIAYEFARFGYCHVRRLQKRFGLQPFSASRAHCRIWGDYRRLLRQRLWTLEDLRGRDFVYFPLSVEPEVTLTRESPEFNHQPFALHAIASNLPADTVLAVKEHISSIGTRPRDFYRAIAKIPNVVLLDPREWGLDVIRKARAVATINGTSGFEAAVLGVPVLTFSSHNKYNLMPHVRLAKGWHDMEAALSDVLKWAGDEQATRKREGDRYLNALVATSVDCGAADFRSTLDPDLLDKIVALLDRSLLAENISGPAAALLAH